MIRQIDYMYVNIVILSLSRIPKDESHASVPRMALDERCSSNLGMSRSSKLVIAQESMNVM